MAQVIFSELFRPFFKKPPPELHFSISANHQNIKHAIELLGLPHTQVGTIRLQREAHSTEVNFQELPQMGDQYFVEPPVLPVDVTATSKLRPEPYPPYRFIVDVCVAALTPKLRMMGCDVFYEASLHDRDLAKVSQEEKRVLLTRDRGLLMRKQVEWGHFLLSTDPKEQVAEVVERFGIPWLPQAFQRCLVCNGHLVSVPKEKIWNQLEPKTRIHYQDFSQCDQCQKIYWEGSHYQKMVDAAP